MKAMPYRLFINHRFYLSYHTIAEAVRAARTMQQMAHVYKTKIVDAITNEVWDEWERPG